MTVDTWCQLGVTEIRKAVDFESFVVIIYFGSQFRDI